MGARFHGVVEAPTALTGVADGRLVLDDGRRVVVSPVHTADAPAEQAFVTGLSPASRYQRFHLGIRELSPETLLRFTHVDQWQHVALVARPAGAGESGEIVADARYVREGDAAEFAVAVADAWQGQGLGRALLGRLASLARAQGVRSLFGDVLWGNETMLGLARSLGARLARHPGDSTLVRVHFGF